MSTPGKKGGKKTSVKEQTTNATPEENQVCGSIAKNNKHSSDFLENRLNLSLESKST